MGLVEATCSQPQVILRLMAYSPLHIDLTSLPTASELSYFYALGSNVFGILTYLWPRACWSLYVE